MEIRIPSDTIHFDLSALLKDIAKKDKQLHRDHILPQIIIDQLTRKGNYRLILTSIFFDEWDSKDFELKNAQGYLLLNEK